MDDQTEYQEELASKVEAIKMSAYQRGVADGMLSAADSAEELARIVPGSQVHMDVLIASYRQAASDIAKNGIAALKRSTEKDA